MRIGIIGLGAIGGWLAGFLGSEAAGEVTLSAVLRGAALEAVGSRGLCLETAVGSPDGQAQARTVRLRVSERPEDLGEQDLVILSVKGPALAEAAPLVLPLLGPHTRVLVAMNGVPWWFFQGFGGPCQGLALESVDPGGRIAQLMGAERVIGSVVHASCSVPEPGRVRHVMGMGLILGLPAGGSSHELQSLAGLLQRCGFAVTLSDCIQRDIWYKLWGNMTMNPISALTGATCDRILDDELVRGFVSAVMREAAELGARIGCPVDQTPEQRHAVTRKLGAFKTSMLQDAEAGRRIELAALVGAVQEIARALGQPTPHTDTLLGLTRLMAQTRGLL